MVVISLHHLVEEATVRVLTIASVCLLMFGHNRNISKFSIERKTLLLLSKTAMQSAIGEQQLVTGLSSLG